MFIKFIAWNKAIRFIVNIDNSAVIIDSYYFAFY